MGNMPLMLPTTEIDMLTMTATDAVDLAAEGKLADGYASPLHAALRGGDGTSSGAAATEEDDLGALAPGTLPTQALSTDYPSRSHRRSRQQLSASRLQETSIKSGHGRYSVPPFSHRSSGTNCSGVSRARLIASSRSSKRGREPMRSPASASGSQSPGSNA
jgi:hypothetical protein